MIKWYSFSIILLLQINFLITMNQPLQQALQNLTITLNSLSNKINPTSQQPEKINPLQKLVHDNIGILNVEAQLIQQNLKTVKDPSLLQEKYAQIGESIKKITHAKVTLIRSFHPTDTQFNKDLLRGSSSYAMIKLLKQIKDNEHLHPDYRHEIYATINVISDALGIARVYPEKKKSYNI